MPVTTRPEPAGPSHALVRMNVDDLVAELDRRGEQWNLYRLSLGGWAVHLGNGREDPANRVVPKVTVEKGGAPTILEALRAAYQSPRLPVVPPCPGPMHREEYDFRRDGSYWSVRRNGSHVCGRLKSRREAEAVVDRWCEERALLRAAWKDRWSEWVASRVAGQDFYWEGSL